MRFRHWRRQVSRAAVIPDLAEDEASSMSEEAAAVGIDLVLPGRTDQLRRAAASDRLPRLAASSTPFLWWARPARVARPTPPCRSFSTASGKHTTLPVVAGFGLSHPVSRSGHQRARRRRHRGQPPRGRHSPGRRLRRTHSFLQTSHPETLMLILMKPATTDDTVARRLRRRR